MTAHLHADAGRILFKGVPVDRMRAPRRYELGISRTFQVLQGFHLMSPLDNVVVAAIGASVAHPVTASMAMLEQVGLADKALGELSALTVAETKNLELARAMVSEPELLLLDEPLAGLNEAERVRFFQIVDDLVDSETAIVVIEHSVRSLIRYVESIVALDDGRIIDFRVGQRERVAILGPNGAGKTTLLKTISGTVEPDSGSIRLDGQDLLAQAPHKRVEAGIVHVPQGRMIFASMTVADNLRLGSHRRVARDRHDERRELVLEIFPALADMLGRDGGALSGGQQQMLAVARGVMACPRLLMLDEPSMGLAPRAADDVFEGIARLLESETTAMIVVEQRAHEALEVCDRAYVLESGEVALEATNRELLADERLAAAYLGSQT